jgi:hypothetical protein
MTGQITRRLRPEAEELALKHEELADLLTALSDRELELANLRHGLAALEVRYLREVGNLYAELDSWNIKIRELRARRNPLRAEEHDQDDDQTGDQTGGCGASTAHSPAPTPELKHLYWNTARRIHPDLAGDPLEQERRTRFMAEANRSYQAADAEALQRILEDFHYGEAAHGESAGAELLRLIRQIRDGKERLTALDEELSTLRGSEIARLRKDVDVAAQQGRDMLAELSQVICGQIQRAEKIHTLLSIEPLA